MEDFRPPRDLLLSSLVLYAVPSSAGRCNTVVPVLHPGYRFDLIKLHVRKATIGWTIALPNHVYLLGRAECFHRDLCLEIQEQTLPRFNANAKRSKMLLRRETARHLPSCPQQANPGRDNVHATTLIAKYS